MHSHVYRRHLIAIPLVSEEAISTTRWIEVVPEHCTLVTTRNRPHRPENLLQAMESRETCSIQEEYHHAVPGSIDMWEV